MTNPIAKIHSDGYWTAMPGFKKPVNFARMDVYAEPVEPGPVDMILYCPLCGLKHVDEPEIALKAGAKQRWTNPPHRSHLCHGCGYIWRPSDIPTNGVQSIETKGKDDNPPVAIKAHTIIPALNKCIAKWREKLREVGSMDNELVGVPARGVKILLDEVEIAGSNRNAMNAFIELENVLVKLLPEDSKGQPEVAYACSNLRKVLEGQASAPEALSDSNAERRDYPGDRKLLEALSRYIGPVLQELQFERGTNSLAAHNLRLCFIEVQKALRGERAALAAPSTPIGSISKGHLKSMPEPWCKEILLYSPNNTGDSPESRVLIYAAPSTPTVYVNCGECPMISTGCKDKCMKGKEQARK